MTICRYKRYRVCVRQSGECQQRWWDLKHCKKITKFLAASAIDAGLRRPLGILGLPLIFRRKACVFSGLCCYFVSGSRPTERRDWLLILHLDAGIAYLHFESAKTHENRD